MKISMVAGWNEELRWVAGLKKPMLDPLKSTLSPKRPCARLLLFTNDSIVQSRNVIGSIFTLA